MIKVFIESPMPNDNDLLIEVFGLGKLLDMHRITDGQSATVYLTALQEVHVSEVSKAPPS